MRKRKISISLIMIMLFNLLVPIYVDMASVEAADDEKKERPEYGERLDYLLQEKVDKRVSPISYSGDWMTSSDYNRDIYKSKVTTEIYTEREFEYFSVSIDLKGKGRDYLIDNPEYDKHRRKNDKTYSPPNIFQYFSTNTGDDSYGSLWGFDKFYIEIDGEQNYVSHNPYYKIKKDYAESNSEYYKASDYRDGYKFEMPIDNLPTMKKQKIIIHLPKMVQFDPLLRILEHFKLNINYRIKNDDGSIELKTVPLIYYVDNKTEINIYSHLMKGDYPEKLDQDMLYKPGIDLYEDKEDLEESQYNIFHKKDYENEDKTKPLNGRDPIKTDENGMAKYPLDYKMDFELRTGDGNYKLDYGLGVNGDIKDENSSEKDAELYLVSDDDQYLVKGYYPEYAKPIKGEDIKITSTDTKKDFTIKGTTKYWISDKEIIHTLRIDEDKIGKTEKDIKSMGAPDNYKNYAYINYPKSKWSDKDKKVKLDYYEYEFAGNTRYMKTYISDKNATYENPIEETNIEKKPIEESKDLNLYIDDRIYKLKEEEGKKFYLIEKIDDTKSSEYSQKIYDLEYWDKKNPEVGDILVFVIGKWYEPIKVNYGENNKYKDKAIDYKKIEKDDKGFYYKDGSLNKKYLEKKDSGYVVNNNPIYIHKKTRVNPYYIKHRTFDKYEDFPDLSIGYKDYYAKTRKIGTAADFDYTDSRMVEKGSSLTIASKVQYIDRMVSWELINDESYIKVRYNPVSSESKFLKEYFSDTRKYLVGNDELQNCVYQVGSDVKSYVIEETSVKKDKFDKKTKERYDFKLPMYADQDGVKMESIKVYEMKELVKSILGDKYNTLLGENEPYYYEKLPQYYLRYIDTNKYMDYHIYFLNYMPKIRMNGNNKAYEFKEEFDLEIDILNKNFDALAYWEMDIVRPEQIKIDREQVINYNQKHLFDKEEKQKELSGRPPIFSGEKSESMDKIDYYLYLINLYKEKEQEGIPNTEITREDVEKKLDTKITDVWQKLNLNQNNVFNKKLLRGVALNKVLEEDYKIDSSHDLVRLCNLRHKIEGLGTIDPVVLDPYEGKNIEKDIVSFNEDIDKINKLTEALNKKEIKSYAEFYKALEDFAKLEIDLRELELKKEKINLSIEEYNSDSIKIDKIGRILDGLYLIEGKEPIRKEDIENLIKDLEENFKIETWEKSKVKKNLSKVELPVKGNPQDIFNNKEDFESYMKELAGKTSLEDKKELVSSYLDIQKGIFDIEEIIQSKTDPMEELNTNIESPKDLDFKDVAKAIKEIGKAGELPDLNTALEELKRYKQMLVNNDSFLKDTIAWKYEEVENFEKLQDDRDKRLKLRLKAHLDDKSESLNLDEDGYISCFKFRYGNADDDDENKKDTLLKETLDKKIFTGAIRVTKQDETKKTLPGAKFYLKNEGDQYYTDLVEDNIWTENSKEAKEFISMEDGSFLVRGLGNEEDKIDINQEGVEVTFKRGKATLHSGKSTTDNRKELDNVTRAYIYKEEGNEEIYNLDEDDGNPKSFKMKNNSRIYIIQTHKEDDKVKNIWTRREDVIEAESYKFLVEKTIENFDEPNVDENDMKPTIMNDGLVIKYDKEGEVSIYDSKDIFKEDGVKLQKEVTGFNKIEMKKEGKVYVRIERKNDELKVEYPNGNKVDLGQFFDESKNIFKKNIDLTEVNRPGYEDPGLTGDDKINFYKDLQETLLDNLIELIPEDEKEIKEKENIESIIDLIDTKVKGLDSKDNLIIKLEEIKKELVISDLRLEIACKESKNEDVRELSNKLVEILGVPGKGCLCNKALRFDIYTDDEKITYTLFNNKLRTIYFNRNDIPIELIDNSSYEKKEIFVGSDIKLNKENKDYELTTNGETQKTYNDVNKIYKISNGEKKEIKETSQLYPGQEFELVFDDASRIGILNIDDQLKIIEGKKYILEESSPPSGYKLKDQDMNVFTNVPSYKKDEGPVRDNDLVIGPGLKNIVNIKVSLHIKVKDEYNESPVVGASYTILSSSNTNKIDNDKYEWVELKDSELYELIDIGGKYLETDDEGKIQVDVLGFGEYALQEKEVGGFYHRTWPKIKFELKEDQRDQSINIDTYKKGRIALLNVSDGGELIEASEFSIKSEKPTTLTLKDLTSDKFIEKNNPLYLKTNYYGLIEIDGLDEDKYTINQKSVSEEYILEEQDLKIEISDEKQKTSHASLFINRKPELPVTGGPGLTRRLVIASLLIITGTSFLIIYNNKKIRDEKGEVEMK